MFYTVKMLCVVCVCFFLTACAGVAFFPHTINDLRTHDYRYKSVTYNKSVTGLNNSISEYNIKCGLLPHILAIGEAYRFNSTQSGDYILYAHSGGDVYLVASAMEKDGKTTVIVWSTVWRNAEYLLNILGSGMCIDSIWNKALQESKS